MDALEHAAANQSQCTAALGCSVQKLQEAVALNTQQNQHNISELRSGQAETDGKLDAAIGRIEALLSKRFKGENDQ